MARIYEAEDGVEPVSDSFAEQVGNQHLYGWLSGCAVTYSLSDMTVDLAAGQILFNGAPVTVAAATDAWTVVADGTNPRWSWLALESDGTPTLVSGTAAAQPTVPELGDRVAVALLLVPANETIANDITYKLDKRVPAHGSPAWFHIDTQVLSTTAASVSFQNIPPAYRDFRVTAYVENDTTPKSIYLRFNNDSGNNYSRQSLTGVGSSATAALAQAAAQIQINSVNAIAASESGMVELTAMKPAATSEALVRGTAVTLGGSDDPDAIVFGGVWENTADLISRIDLLASAGNFAANTRVTLEGCAWT